MKPEDEVVMDSKPRFSTWKDALTCFPGFLIVHDDCLPITVHVAHYSTQSIQLQLEFAKTMPPHVVQQQ